PAGNLSLTLPPEAQWKGAAGLRLAAPHVEPRTPADMLARAKQLTARYRFVDYDPDLRAKELGDGVEPSFQYVRDRVRFEAYPGVLRGARGAYITRAGNAPDRS